VREREEGFRGSHSLKSTMKSTVKAPDWSTIPAPVDDDQTLHRRGNWGSGLSGRAINCSSLAETGIRSEGACWWLAVPTGPLITATLSRERIWGTA
jgi:hypothetical protein